MIRKLLAFVPFLLVMLPWLATWALGGRMCAGIITGMPPAGVDFGTAVLLGFGYVFASLLGMLAGPPLLVTGVFVAVQGRSSHRAIETRPMVTPAVS